MVMKHIFASAIVALLCGSSGAHALTNFNDGHGKVWRQVTETTNLSWSDLATVCPLDAATACSGSVKGVNMTGWVFASIDQVGDLFSYFGDYPGGINLAYAPQATSHAAQFFDTAFDQTYSDNIYRAVFGFSSTPHPGGNIWGADVLDLAADSPNPDLWYGSNQHGDTENDLVGAWMWQSTVSAVPEPSTWAILITGFLGVGVALRRRRQSFAAAISSR